MSVSNIACSFSSDSWRALLQCCHMSHMVVISHCIRDVVHLWLDFLDVIAFKYISCSSCHCWTIQPSKTTSILSHPARSLLISILGSAARPVLHCATDGVQQLFVDIIVGAFTLWPSSCPVPLVPSAKLLLLIPLGIKGCVPYLPVDTNSMDIWLVSVISSTPYLFHTVEILKQAWISIIV